jgi:VWFA-related protein
MRRHAVITLLLAATPAGAVQAPPPAPVFREQTDLVVVDVVVADKNGNPVTGLRKEDFTVLDEKAPQSISSFEAVTVPSPPPDAAPSPGAPPPRVATNVGTERAGRTFTLVFDNVHMSPLHAYRAKQAVAAFLEKGTREGDRVSLIATGGGAWWSTRMRAGRADLISLVKTLDGRRMRDASAREQITDFEAIRVHLYQDTQVGRRVAHRFEQMGVNTRDSRAEEFRELYLPGVNEPLVEARAAEAYAQIRRRHNLTLGALERALRALEGSRGRKALVLVSEGFVLDPNNDGFEKVIETARRSNVALYFVDTRGLEGMSSVFSAEIADPPDARDYGAIWADSTQDAEGSDMLALDTGGFTVRNTNDVARGIERIARESESYYLIGYTPPVGPHDGRFRRIEVKLARKGLVVRARKGYYAPRDTPAPAPSPAATVAANAPAPAPTPTPKPLTKAEADRDLQLALDSPFTIDGIRLRLTALVLDETTIGRARTLVAAEVDAANLDFVTQDGKLVDTLDVLTVAAHRDSGDYARRDQKLEMAFSPQSRERLRESWYPVMQDFELSPGRYQAKIVVRDGNTKKLGSVVYEFEVPPLDVLRVSTPVLTNRIQQPPGQPAPSPVLSVRRSFASGDTLYCQFDVYGAQKDNVTSRPHVTASYVLLRPDGTAREKGGPSAMIPTSLGRISQLLWLPLEGADPGEYELTLRVRDELSGQEREIREPFVVVSRGDAASHPPGPPSLARE